MTQRVNREFDYGQKSPKKSREIKPLGYVVSAHPKADYISGPVWTWDQWRVAWRKQGSRVSLYDREGCFSCPYCAHVATMSGTLCGGCGARKEDEHIFDFDPETGWGRPQKPNVRAVLRGAAVRLRSRA